MRRTDVLFARLAATPGRAALAAWVVAWTCVAPFVATASAQDVAPAAPTPNESIDSNVAPAETVAPRERATPRVVESPVPVNTPLGPGGAAQAGAGVRGDAPAGEPPSYKPLRYDEDYSYLRDPSRREDFWDPIKYIPLGGREDVYLSLGGETRQWFECYHNDGFGLGPANADGYNVYPLQRYLLHADLHVGPRFRAFGQLMSGQQSDRIGGPRPEIDRDAFDAHQAFVDWVVPWGDESSLTWRVGRQELRYGSGRLIDVREGPNLRRSFDAARALVKAGDWSIDGWWSRPVINQLGVFDDEPDAARSFWGVYATRSNDAASPPIVDLYYLGLVNEEAAYEQGSGVERRHTLGARWSGKPGGWEYNLEYALQFGAFGSGEILAWTAAHAARYSFDELPLRPRLGLRADVASGDDDPASPNLQTFNPLFPSGAYFNLANPVGPSNLVDCHPVLDLHFGERVAVTADWNFFWRESLEDGVYRLSGSLLAASGGSRARYVGNSPSLTAIFTPTRHSTVLVSYVHFFPGPFIRQTTPGKDLDYFTTWFTYKF